MQLLKAMVLIGSPPNPYIVNLLRQSISFLDGIYLPDSLKFELKGGLRPLETNANFWLSGYSMQTTIYVLMFQSMQFLLIFMITLASLSFLFGVRLFYVGFHKFEKFLNSLNKKLLNSAFIAFPFRFFLENSFFFFVTFAIEIGFLAGKYNTDWRELSHSKIYILGIVISGLCILIIFSIFQIIIYRIIFLFYKWKFTQKSNLYLLTQGFNLRRPIYTFLYFLHYFFIRIMIALLILFTPFERSVVLWGILFGAQLICLLINIPKIYYDYTTYFLTLIREVQILFVVIYLFSLHYYSENIDETWKVKQFTPFMGV